MVTARTPNFDHAEPSVDPGDGQRPEIQHGAPAFLIGFRRADQQPAGAVRFRLHVPNLVLIPVRPSPGDLRAVGTTLAAVNESGMPFAFVMSQTPRARITEEAARVLAQHGRVAPVNIAHRVAYAETGATGQGVTETRDKKAGAEMVAVWDYVKGILNA